MTEVQYPWQQEVIIRHTQHLLHSYQHWTGESLFDLSMAPLDLSQVLFHAPFIVVSHGMETNPIFNYANQKALELWELEWNQFIQMPSCQTVEQTEREDRQKLLEETEKKGFTDKCSGVRVSSTGKKFYIENIKLWNVLDENQQRCGQAAMFYQWQYI
ncbi:MAG: MEKHLA domain-containing protein [Calothrix sp. C42_A2020_038]|nr:MEKHLA domain-containing protein [Calothrix sp. C42_A2020_038]